MPTPDSTRTQQACAKSLFGEADFIFIDLHRCPYLVHEEEDTSWWLYRYSDPTRNFVSVRSLSLIEMEAYRALALPRADALLYFRD